MASGSADWISDEELADEFEDYWEAHEDCDCWMMEEMLRRCGSYSSLFE